MDRDLDIVVVPTAAAFVVLPAVMVRQVLPYAPVIPEAGALDYVCGTLIVQEHKLNVIDMSVFVGAQTHKPEAGEKLIWFSSLHINHNLSGYILQSSGAPRFMQCHEIDITESEPSEHPLIAYYVKITGLENPDDLPIFVPDLVNLEAELAS